MRWPWQKKAGISPEQALLALATADRIARLEEQYKAELILARAQREFQAELAILRAQLPKSTT